MTLPMPLYSEHNLSADGNDGNHRTTQHSQPAISTASVPKNVERVDPGSTSKYSAAESVSAHFFFKDKVWHESWP